MCNFSLCRSFCKLRPSAVQSCFFRIRAGNPSEAHPGPLQAPKLVYWAYRKIRQWAHWCSSTARNMAQLAQEEALNACSIACKKLWGICVAGGYHLGEVNERDVVILINLASNPTTSVDMAEHGKGGSHHTHEMLGEVKKPHWERSLNNMQTPVWIWMSSFDCHLQPFREAQPEAERVGIGKDLTMRLNSLKSQWTRPRAAKSPSSCMSSAYTCSGCASSRTCHNKLCEVSTCSEKGQALSGIHTGICMRCH